MSPTARTPTADASALRTLSLVLVLAAAVGLVFGTAGFSAMEADRGLAVNVTDDERAYLGYEPIDTSVESGNATDVIEFHNRFSTDLRLDVRVSADGDHLSDVNTTLTEGEKESVPVSLTCADGESIDLTFDVTGEGSGISVSLERTHTVTCVSPVGTNGTDTNASSVAPSGLATAG